MNRVELGFRIKQRRKMLRITQEKLAEIIGASPHYIYEIERGLKTMSLSTLVDISSALNISADYLLFGAKKNISDYYNKEPAYDRLNLLLQNLSPQQRENLADIIAAMLPYLK